MLNYETQPTKSNPKYMQAPLVAAIRPMIGLGAQPVLSQYAGDRSEHRDHKNLVYIHENIDLRKFTGWINNILRLTKFYVFL